MKWIITWLIVFSLTSLFGQVNLDSMQLFGKVWKIKEIDYSIDKNNSKKLYFNDSTHYEFNVRGFLTKNYESYAGLGTCRFWKKYNEEGFIVQSHCPACCLNGFQGDRFYYNEQNQLLTIHNKISSDSYTTFRYDSLNLLFEKKYTTVPDLFNHGFWSITSYTYDQDKNLIFETFKITDSLGKIIGDSTTLFYEYDTLNRLIKQQSYVNKIGQITYCNQTLFKYENGKLTQKQYTDSDSSNYTVFYEYQNDHLLKQKFSGKNYDIYNKNIYQIENTIYFAYDNHGSLIYKYNKNQESKYTYNYTYDTYGNWTEKTIFINDIPFFKTKRKIKYYT
jgi:hypothetical protein